MHFLSFTLINNLKIMPLSSTFTPSARNTCCSKFSVRICLQSRLPSEKFNLQILPFPLLYFVTAETDISTKHVKSNINISALP
jgi:hypothetical protein